MIGGLTTETLRDTAALAAIENEWWDLWRCSTGTTPFQSPAWLRPWWDAFSPGELCAVTVRRSGALVGLAPFYIEAGARGRRVMPLGISLSDYLDVLLHREFVAPAGAAMIAHLARERWQSCELSELPPGAAAWHLPAPPACDGIEESAGTCLGRALPPTVEALAMALPGGKRRKIRLARNRVARCGGYAIVNADAVNLQHLVSELMRLHALRWEARGEPGVLADARVVSFHRAAAPRLLAAGLLRLFGLRIAGRIAAVFYGFHHDKRLYAYLTGFDPDFAFVSPGTLIVAHAIEQAIEEGAHEMDFLRGEEAFKHDWGAMPRRTGRRVFHRIPAHAGA